MGALASAGALAPTAASGAGPNLLQLGLLGAWLALPPGLSVGVLEGVPPRLGPWASATTGGAVGLSLGFLGARALGQLPPGAQGLGLGALTCLGVGQAAGVLGGHLLWASLAAQTQGLDHLSPLDQAPQPFWVPWQFRDRPLNW